MSNISQGGALDMPAMARHLTIEHIGLRSHPIPSGALLREFRRRHRIAGYQKIGEKPDEAHAIEIVLGPGSSSDVTCGVGADPRHQPTCRQSGLGERYRRP